MQDSSLIQKTKGYIYQWFQNESVFTNTLATVVGILTGLAIVIYEHLIKDFTDFFFGTVSQYPSYFVILVPATGGLLVGLISYMFVNSRRSDVEEIIESSALHDGKIRHKYAFLEVLSSLISISSGGSVGKESPGVLAGSGIGSYVAHILKTNREHSKILVGCGASGGIAAAFNAPLAGVVFVVEVIFGELKSNTFIPIVVAAVFSNLVSNMIFGVMPIEVSYFKLVSPVNELFLYLILGVLAGVVSIIIIRSMYLFYDGFHKLPFHPISKPAIGGLGVGLIGLFYPQIFGVGYNVIMNVLANEFTMQLMLILLFLKIFAFSLTLGSGGSGGSIVPALFVGAMLGGVYGNIVNGIFPDMTAEAGAYAMVGMGSVFAGTLHAPLTGMLILFELTRDYQLILPLMFACVISNAIANALHLESLYTEGLRRRGLKIWGGQQVDVMKSMLVEDAMVKDVQSVLENNTVGTLIHMMQSSKHGGFPVLDLNRKLRGIVTLQDLREKVKYGEVNQRISEIMYKNVAVAYPDETLDTVLNRLAKLDIGRLPVVSRDDETELLGLITRSDIINTYNKKIITRKQESEEG
ncbi:Cl- channel voltage-gated family protein [Methanohalobium evestigatum Z-7303]|uniref:Cl-channel voltage-gated family protein n=1 Tax=Methanohalobium evestigatum (strain ATCC BAA-1072 / DSM 3721 / NBRC 107634 / OCM 161 / Z-7303) TaxID=644295 RepID=D7EA83_METEZ|nr:chloride channel protein [Methanohalobium evestigatum]ADI74754.1 Cl- channel voltage-gated family protein [Methanohalobium evestigatum Z-7303]